MPRTGMHDTAVGRTLLALATAALIAGCGGGDPTPAPAADAAPPVSDQPAQDVPPATAPADDAKPTDEAPAGDALTNDAPNGDLGLARFDGYGDVKFGTAAADMEKAWGGDLKVEGQEYNESCYFMTPTWVKVPAELAFMIGDGKFARYSTESAKNTAPGGGRIGMADSEIEALYPGRIERQPHHYTDGKYLRIKDAASGSVLVFETDGAGKVTEWRVGKEPHIDYVEGCS